MFGDVLGTIFLKRIMEFINALPTRIRLAALEVSCEVDGRA